MSPIKIFTQSLFTLTAFFFLTFQAFALDISSLKDQGIIGELSTGYVGIVIKNPSQEVKNFVVDINEKRKMVYISIAEKNNTSLEKTEAVAGKRNFDKTQSGHYVMVNGSWRKK